MSTAAAFVAIQTGKPTILWGQPGTGKTSWIKALARHLNIPAEIVIASIREPSDFAGLPIITQDDDVRLAPPNWARRLAEAERGILFLDELSTAPPAVQSAALRVVNERVVGDIELPPTIWIVAAANPTDTSSGTWTLSAALANRFIHIHWAVRPQEWIEGMLGGWQNIIEIDPLQESWINLIPVTTNLMASFIKSRPQLLINEPSNAESAGRAWPSPRTWEMAAHVLAAARAVKANKDIEVGLVAGSVGDGAASEFFVWEKNLDLPDPVLLLKDPSLFVVPSRDDQTFAILSAVVMAARDSLTAKTWQAAWEILAMAASEGHADVAAIPAKLLAGANTKNLPVPKQVKAFLPVLQAARLI